VPDAGTLPSRSADPSGNDAAAHVVAVAVAALAVAAAAGWAKMRRRRGAD
jgi:hypothetical protein